MKLSLAPLVLAAMLAAPAVAAESPRCAVPESVAALGEALPRFAAAWATPGPVRIVALGSSSTAGTGASAPEHAYPAQLERLLRAAAPGREVRVINAGVGGDDAPRMMARLEADVAAHRPHLVIWQSGTNDILDGVALEDFVAQHRDGVARLKALGADVLLIETQWFARLIARPDHLRYVQALRDVADGMDVPLVRRFDMMAWWAASDTMSASAMLAGDKFHMKDASYRCLAEQVATALLRASGRLTQAANRPR